MAWDALGDWRKVDTAGAGGDHTKAIQDAIDAGKTTVYFPRGKYTITATIQIRGNVRRIIGCEAQIDWATSLALGFTLVDGTHPVVAVERLRCAGRAVNYSFDNASGRTLVLKDITRATTNATGTGDIFIEDVVGAPFKFKGQNVYANKFYLMNNDGSDVQTHILQHFERDWGDQNSYTHYWTFTTNGIIWQNDIISGDDSTAAL
jgi:hypothetical protein